VFPGFYRPRSNYYRLPNAWFGAWRAARAAQGGGRIVGPLKTTEYVVKWTWGYQNFDRPLRISWQNFQYGRLTGKVRLDRGTGLSSRILGAALDTAVASGFLERHGDAQQPTYLPHLRPAAEDAAGFLAEDPDVAAAGFAPPQANFFVVPALWTDLTSDLSSEVLILAVEYLFRHTWGWEGGWERPCWLTAEEFAAGRRYRSAIKAGERYDEGLGYSERALRDALAEGVKRGWLVWQEVTSGGRVYALHLKGMRVAEDGRFLGADGDITDERAPLAEVSPLPLPTPSAAARPEQAAAADPTRLAQLEGQVRALTHEVQALTAALAGVGVALPTQASSAAGAEESKAATEQSKATTAGSEAVDGGTYSTSYTDTPDTSQTPAPDTRAAQPAIGGGGVAALPADLRQLVVGLDFRGRRSWAELATAYQADPARVDGWVRYLDAHRREFQQPAGYLLQSVVRDDAPLPAGAAPAPHGNGAGPSGSCAACGGRGGVTLNLPPGDPDYGRTIPCPYCSGQGQTHGTTVQQQ